MLLLGTTWGNGDARHAFSQLWLLILIRKSEEKFGTRISISESRRYSGMKPVSASMLPLQRPSIQL